MRRRDFVYFSASAVASLTLAQAFGCNSEQTDIEAQPFFFSHIADVKTITSVGLAYRKMNAGENNKNMLSELLLANSNPQIPADNNVIRSMLENKVQTDFKNGKIIVVDGWVLSVTEARQCALFSILRS